jgi:UDP-2,3-diacylglucosamine hydrolase
MVHVHAFVADLHLRPDAKDAADRFVSWLSHAKRGSEEIFILGDLFDYWYSGMEARFPEVMEALRSPGIHIMPGNRDFLLRNAHIQGVNVTEAEEMTIALGEKKILLAHGHTLTDADTGFRLLHRYGWPVLERIDRLLPAHVKGRLARAMVKSSAIVRPSTAVIRSGIAGMKGVDMVICGHLHRHVEQEGLIVLPAFFESGTWLEWDAAGPQTRTFPQTP